MPSPLGVLDGISNIKEAEDGLRHQFLEPSCRFRATGGCRLSRVLVPTVIAACLRFPDYKDTGPEKIAQVLLTFNGLAFRPDRDHTVRRPSAGENPAALGARDGHRRLRAGRHLTKPGLSRPTARRPPHRP
jgi:hypothetical protein